MAERLEREVRVYQAEDLLSYRDEQQFSAADLSAEMHRVYEATTVERQWLKGLVPYKDDAAILLAGGEGELVRIQPTVGILPIQRLLEYSAGREDPSHDFHYSPPFLKPGSWQAAQFIGVAWAERQRAQRDEPYIFLPLTSATRSSQYQHSLTEREERKIAIDSTGDDSSSHEFGWAFDIDGSGLYRYDPLQRHVQSINPRASGFNNEAALVAYSREDLKGILMYLRDNGIINFVEEVPGTKEWCFHICVNPQADVSELGRKTS